jgi:uncharacterized protein YdhG (YjbR/CyaY superfamily)
MQRGQYSNVDEYIALFSAPTRAGLAEIRKTIKTAAPKAEDFREKLKKYETSKGAIRFPLDQPIPVKLITDIVKWKMKDNLSAGKPKKKG